MFFTAYLLVQMQQVEVWQKAELSGEPWQVERCLQSVELWREVEQKSLEEHWQPEAAEALQERSEPSQSAAERL